MKSLGTYWLTEPTLDYEFKKYTLLAYIQQVDRELEQLKYHPANEVVDAEIARIDHFIHSMIRSEILLPRELSGVDLHNNLLEFTHTHRRSEAMNVVSSVAEFARENLAQLQHRIELLYEILCEEIHVEPVGVVPVVPTFGYLFIEQPKKVKVFEYEVSHIADSMSLTNDLIRIKTTYYDDYSISIGNTYENVRTELIDKGEIGNPGTFLVTCERPLPVEATLLPIGSRMMGEFIKKAPFDRSNGAP